MTSAVTHDWELEEGTGATYQFTKETGNYVHTFGWEAEFLGNDDSYADSTFVTTWLFELFNQANKFKVKYTYARQDGDTVIAESNGSPETVVGVDVLNAWLASWTASPDTQVTHVRIYRTLANGSLYLFETVAVAADGAAGSIILTDSDGELGDGIPTDHDRPPAAGTVVFGPDFDGTVFILAGNKLYPSKPKQPEYYPPDDAIEVSSIQDPLIAGTIWNGNVYVATKSDIYQIQGTGSATLFPYGLSVQTGTQSQQVFLGIMGFGIYHLGPDGLYLFNGEIDLNITEDRFEPIFRGITTNGIPGLALNNLDSAWLVHWDNKLYLGYEGVGVSTTSILVIALKTGKIRYYDYGLNFTTAMRDITNRRILAGASTGVIWHLEKITAAKDDDADIAWEVQSKDFTLQTRPHFPRWAKYDVDSSKASEVTAEILLDDAIHQSHVIAAAQSRKIRRRLITEGNGGRASIRISGLGPATTYLAEME
ncbi:MAG: hypothetical protein JRD68_00100 [Deltaproteobacteria bacterium]|nr:hypothetical protein [Deltaproteobacteria bacterium]